MAVGAGLAALLLSGVSAQAELAVCNRTSYVLETALALEQDGIAATRGWFRVLPGDCRTVMPGGPPQGKLHVHARALPLYAVASLTPETGVRFCVGTGDSFIAAGQGCAAADRLAFIEVEPRVRGDRSEVDLTDADGFSLAAARHAGLQRLLTMAGHDALPIDGAAGPRTDGALAAFRREHKLGTGDDAALWSALLAAAAEGSGIGLVWCNETADPVLAAWAEPEKGATVARGWYRIAPGACASARPEPLSTSRLYSFAEAVDGEGAPLKRDGAAVAWGGPVMLCTRSARFEIREHADCTGRGYDATGFAPLDVAGRAGVRIHLGSRR